MPVSLLLSGAFLTHSRGALLALVAMSAVAAWRNLGKAPAIVIAVVLFAGAMALQFTGGRAISATAGSDRTALWGSGIQMLKESPLFGVGFNQFADHADNTAHNSVLVCAAELGLFGFFFWCLFLFPTLRDTLALASTKGQPTSQSPDARQSFAPLQATNRASFEKEDVHRFGSLLVYSLTGFLVAAMFLSRAFVLTFFLLGGFTEVVYQRALSHGMVAPRLKPIQNASRSAALATGLLILMYVTVRILNFAR